MQYIFRVLQAATAVAALALAGPATAEPISVGFNFIPFGGTLTGNNGDIETSSSVSFTGGSYAINGIDLANNTNNIGVAIFGEVSLSNPIPLVLGGTFVKTFTANGLTFSESLNVNTVNIGPGYREIVALGIISCGVGCAFSDAYVSFGARYTQPNGPTGQINASFSNYTTGAVPPAPVPEPGSLALLGLGLVGLVGISRRKQA